MVDLLVGGGAVMTPHATYRLQFHAGFRFEDARESARPTRIGAMAVANLSAGSRTDVLTGGRFESDGALALPEIFATLPAAVLANS